MRFLFTSLIAVAAMVVGASSASAIVSTDLTIVGVSGGGCSVNGLDIECAAGSTDTIELDLKLRNDGTAMTGVGLSVIGIDEGADFDTSNDIVGFVSGANGAQLFFDFATFTGLPANAPFVSAAGPGEGNVIRAVAAASTNAAAGDGTNDPTAGGNGGQVGLTLQLSGLGGSASLVIGVAQGDGLFDADGADVGLNASPAINITVVPEPGTALLMGLGLAGLAAAGRRRE